MKNKKKVLFLCTHNSVRSQMAEAITNTYHGDKFEAYSAGTEPDKVNPYVIKVMNEMGVDISHQRSKNVKELLGEKFDYIVTVCDKAKDNCPFFPGGGKYIHKSFGDPSRIQCSEAELPRKFRKTRNRIKDWIDTRLAKDNIDS